MHFRRAGACHIVSGIRVFARYAVIQSSSRRLFSAPHSTHGSKATAPFQNPWCRVRMSRRRARAPLSKSASAPCAAVRPLASG